MFVNLVYQTSIVCCYTIGIISTRLCLCNSSLTKVNKSYWPNAILNHDGLHILVSWCLLMSLLEYAVCMFCGHQNDSAYSWMVVFIVKNWCWSRMTLIHGPLHPIGVQPTAFMGLSECRSMSDLCILNDYGILNNPVLKSMNSSSMLCRLVIWHSVIGPHPRSFSSMTVIRP